MILYRFNESGSYIGWVNVQSDVSYEGQPGFTPIRPPAAEKGEAPAWRNGVWVLEPAQPGWSVPSLPTQGAT